MYHCEGCGEEMFCTSRNGLCIDCERDVENVIHAPFKFRHESVDSTEVWMANLYKRTDTTRGTPDAI